MRDFERIRAVIMRGGTSKAVFLMDNELPKDPKVRDRVILALYGSPDPRQIDGLGGADPLTSKLAIIKPSDSPDADIDYNFGQVVIDRPYVDYSNNCGNISSAVGPFAIDEGLVQAKEPVTTVRIFNVNTQKIIEAEVPVKYGKALTRGDYSIAGVPGTGAKIMLNFLDSGGAKTGKLLPTGNRKDLIRLESGQELEVSIVDAANPAVFLKAADLGLTGKELPGDINNRPQILSTLAEIRSIVAEKLGFVADRREAAEKSPAIPKIAFVAEPADYVDVNGNNVRAKEISLTARTLSMGKMHKAYAVTGGICTATCALLKGTVVNELVRAEALESGVVHLGHPSGVMEFKILLEDNPGVEPHLVKAGVARTARRLMDGYAYVPSKVFWS